jgi:hypothetical protein
MLLKMTRSDQGRGFSGRKEKSDEPSFFLVQFVAHALGEFLELAF